MTLIIALILYFFASATSSSGSFELCYLGLTDKNKRLLQNLAISEELSYDNFGEFENLEPELVEFFKKIGNDQKTSHATTDTVTAMIALSLQKLEAKSAWIAMRASKPSNIFNTPRWHTDGYYFEPMIGCQHKISCTLKGPGALFCSISGEKRAQFNDIHQQMFFNTKGRLKKRTSHELYQAEHCRRAMTTELLAGSAVEQISTGQGVRFLIGDPNVAAVYSEPPLNHDRLHLSILPGTKDQIQELHDRWHPTKK